MVITQLMPASRTLRSLCVILLSIALLCGCSQAAQQPGPYASQYAVAIHDAQSDYVRSILQSGQITSADLKDAEQHTIGCLLSAGINASYGTNEWGLDELTIMGVLTRTQSGAQQQCLDAWMGPIMQLYVDQFTNPNNQDWNTLVAACLVRKGLVPSGFTGQDYSNLMSTEGMSFNSSTMAPDNTGTYSYSSSDATQIVLPGGVSLSDPEATACTIIPLQQS
ncbi:MAG: hypothetical protein FWD75_10165 [Propionibacteriaceae bacterium]|nr:hypothetical protein [Propionibacteriaceae bacterium]